MASHCSQRHGIPAPGLHTGAEPSSNRAAVKRMRKKMRRFGTAEISDQQEREIVTYLKSSGADRSGARRLGSAPLLTGAGRDAVLHVSVIDVHAEDPLEALQRRAQLVHQLVGVTELIENSEYLPIAS